MPIPQWVKGHVDAWTAAAAITWGYEVDIEQRIELALDELADY